MNKQELAKKKTVLAIWHSGGKGKTESARQFAIELLNAYPAFIPIRPNPTTIPATNDFTLIVEINSQIIGVESQGDPGTRLKDRLERLAIVDNCDIIICTCRSRGETVAAVNNLRQRRFGFDIIWTSTYEIDGIAERIISNNAKGQHILNLLQLLGRI